ncbi:MAG: FtsH protease activity modulator HflK [Candidatus Omnitrophica bacterium]|nr:FtsH protease activity modulator HflK [Candidatus Omnitrophota bacterium]
MDFGNKNPDEIIHEFQKKMAKKAPSPVLIIGLIVLFILLKGLFYTVQKDEVGMVLRFGKSVRTASPGLHFKIPLGIEKVFPVKVTHIYKEEFGFRTRSAGVKTIYNRKAYDEESLMLTGDLNVMDIEWTVQFQINDPFNALFKIRNLVKTLRDVSESVMRKVIGDYTFDEVLTKRIEINDLVQLKMQETLKSYETGIKIVTVKLQDVNPPDPVKPAFNEVNEAKQEREKMINQAWEVYNQKIPQARGEAQKIIKEAEGYALERVNKALGDANRFDLLRSEYALAKEITLQRLYLENMSDVLKRAGKKYITDPDEKGILPLLRLDGDLTK